jgi:hypothetical protein
VFHNVSGLQYDNLKASFRFMKEDNSAAIAKWLATKGNEVKRPEPLPDMVIAKVISTSTRTAQTGRLNRDLPPGSYFMVEHISPEHPDLIETYRISARKEFLAAAKPGDILSFPVAPVISRTAKNPRYKIRLQLRYAPSPVKA